MAYKTFANGYVLNASELNTYLMNQTVMVFADSTARSAALATPSAGMVTYLTGTNALEYYNGSTWGAVGVDSTLTNVLITSPREFTNVEATATTGVTNFNIKTAADMYHTSNAAGNFSLNVRGNSSTTLASMLAVGETITITFRVTNGSTAYYMTSLTIDGSAQTVKWQGGSAPSSGNASAVDVYTFAITKTAATPTYVVLGSQVKFA